METMSPDAGEQTAAQQAAIPGALLDGETIVATFDGDEGGSFILTTERVMHVGGGGRSERWASAMIEAVSGADVTSRPKDRSTLGWAVLGFLGALGIWQISTNDVVGIGGGIIIGLIAAALAIDYLFFEPGPVLFFHAASGKVGGPVREADAAEALEFVDRFYALREASKPAAPESPRLPRYPSP